MPSPRKTGQKYVTEARAIYEDGGYVTWSPANKAIFLPGGRAISASQDIFTVFDFLATSVDNIHWVQVKGVSEGDASTARKKIDAIPMPDGTVRVVMSRQKKKRFTFRVWVRIGETWTKPVMIKMGYLKTNIIDKGKDGD